MSRVLLLSSILLLSSGCMSGRYWNGQFYRVEGFLDDVRTSQTESVDLHKICFPESLKDGKCVTPAYDLAATEKVPRNRLQAYLMAASDSKCSIHLSTLLNQATNVNLITGVSALALGAAAPLIKPITTKNAFAAAAALSTGERSLFNEEVFKQMVATTVLKAIISSRESQAAIIASRRDDNTTQYSVDDAIRDVIEYHDRCSFYRGLTELSEAVEKKATCSGIGARREALLARLATAKDEAKKSYQSELILVDKQIADCH